MQITAPFVCLVCLGGVALAQTVLPPTAPNYELPPTTVLPPQRLGVGDLVNVSVYAAPEISRPVRIGSDGKVHIPMLTEPVPAANTMPDELATAISRQLKDDKIMVDPLVTVTVTEYMSKPVSVAGAVRHPTTFQAFGDTTLLMAISKADGLTEEAGPEVLVTSTPNGPDGARTVTRIPIKALMNGSDPSLNLRLKGGEDVSVPAAQKIYVLGNVKKPGAYNVQDSTDSSVLKALALSEGLLPYATKEAFIYRPVAGSTEKQEISVPLEDIVHRKRPDVALEGGDIFYVPDNHAKRLTATVLDRLAGFGAATASGVLIWH
jgi:polysaccharide export outer membrane protein